MQKSSGANRATSADQLGGDHGGRLAIEKEFRYLERPLFFPFFGHVGFAADPSWRTSRYRTPSESLSISFSSARGYDPDSSRRARRPRHGFYARSPRLRSVSPQGQGRL